MLIYCTEQHHIKRNKPIYKIIDLLSLQAMKIYNKATYEERQVYFENKLFLNYNVLYDYIKDTDTFKLLPSVLAQQVLRQVATNFSSFVKASIAYYKMPEKFDARPSIPKYKPKENGRFKLTFTNHAFRLKGNTIHFHKCLDGFTLKTKLTDIQEIQIVPKNGIYVFNVIGLKQIDMQGQQELKYIAGIDMGIDNFSAITVWNNTTKPLIINGKGLKSFNKNYNKRIAKLQSEAKTRHDLYITKRMQRINQKRNNYMQTWMHKASRLTVIYLIQNQVKHLVIGYNKGWKTLSPLSKKVNQTFVQIPYKRYVDYVIYKAREAGITVYIVEESYTSGTSFLDNEPPTKEYYNKNRRLHRGLFQSNTKVKINADINASYQISKKAFPQLHIEEGVFTKQQLHNKLEPIRINVV